MNKGGVGMAKKETEQKVIKEQQPEAEMDKNPSGGEAKAKKKKEKAPKRSRKPEKAINLVGAEEIDSLKIEKAKGWERVKQFLKSKKLRKVVWAIVRTVLLTGLCFLVLYPILTLLIASLKSEQDMYDSTVIFIPRSMSFNNYIAMWNHMRAGTLLINSVISSLGLGILQMVSCTLVAYGLARFKFKGCGFIFALVIITLVIPVQLLADAMKMRYRNFDILTMFSMNSQYLYNEGAGLNLVGGWGAFIAMSATAVMYRNGLYIFLLRQYFKNQPKELEEAAYIDGANTFRTFWQIMLPSALPLLITVFLFAFVFQYNDAWYLKMLYPSAEVMATRIGQAGYTYVTQVLDRQNDAASQTIYDAVAVILHITPLIILYVFCQQFFTQSIERSGMVG